MCAIVDANAAAQVFGFGRPPAGKKFFNWINTGTGRMVVGGELLKELDKLERFRKWRLGARRSGHLRVVNRQVIEKRTADLRAEGSYRSTDPHVLALAQVSGARLLFSNDKGLHRDFKNKRLIDDPRGKVYSTIRTESFRPSHKRLLGRNDLCRA